VTTRRRATRSRLVIALVAALASVAGCSSDDASGPTSTTVADGAATTVTFGESPGADWGPLADCPVEPQSTDPGGTPATEGVDGVLAFGDEERGHVEPCAAFPMHPAVGGDHFRVWANCGFYTSPVPEMAAVHVLEHGGVWIAFDPGLGATDVATIRAATTASTHVLASPYPGLRDRVVMSAWSRQLSLDSPGDARFDAFLDTYVQGPTTPELGAPCSGGLGSPQ